MATFTPTITHTTALITGAGRRIGRALAEDLGRAGWSVAVHYHHSVEEAEEVVAAVTKNGGKAAAVQADLGDAASVAGLVPAAVKALGPLGCMINNASIFERDDIASATLESWNSHIAINLRAPFFLTQAFAAQVEGDARAAIVNLIDERVWHLTPHFASYTVSKTGLWTLTQTLAMALAPRIRVNAIARPWPWRWRRASASTPSAPARPCPAPIRPKNSSMPNARACCWATAPIPPKSAPRFGSS